MLLFFLLFFIASLHSLTGCVEHFSLFMSCVGFTSSSFWALRSCSSGCPTWIRRWSVKSTTFVVVTKPNANPSRTPSIRRNGASKTFEKRTWPFFRTAQTREIGVIYSGTHITLPSQCRMKSARERDCVSKVCLYRAILSLNSLLPFSLYLTLFFSPFSLLLSHSYLSHVWRKVFSVLLRLVPLCSETIQKWRAREKMIYNRVYFSFCPRQDMT